MKDTARAGVLAIVRRMLDKNTEDKFIGWELERNVTHNSPIGPADCYPVVQQIVPIDAAVGSTAQQRMGDRVKPKRLEVRGVVSFNPDQPSNTTQNFYVRICILAQKNIKTGSAIAGGGVDTNRLLRPGYVTGTPGADQVPFSGNTRDLSAPINKDLFRVYYDKIHRISSQLASTTAVEQQVNTFRWKYVFKQLPASLSYDEGNGDWANNFAPFMCFGYAYADGSVPDSLQSRLVSNTSAFLTYEDA